jgi:hypothetical protein
MVLPPIFTVSKNTVKLCDFSRYFRYLYRYFSAHLPLGA